MALGKGRRRLQIVLDAELMDDIEVVCAQAHMTRSAWIEYTLAMAIQSYKDLLSRMSDAMASGIVEGVKIPDSDTEG